MAAKDLLEKVEAYCRRPTREGLPALQAALISARDAKNLETVCQAYVTELGASPIVASAWAEAAKLWSASHDMQRSERCLQAALDADASCVVAVAQRLASASPAMGGMCVERAIAAAGPAHPQVAGWHVAAAERFTVLGQLARAMAHWLSALAQKPNQVAWLQAAAQLALRLGDRRQHQALLEQEVATTTEAAARVALWLKLVDLAVASSDDGAQRRYARLAQQAAPRNVQAIEVLATSLATSADAADRLEARDFFVQLAHQRTDVAARIIDLRRALGLDISSLSILGEIVDALQAGEQWVEAEQLLLDRLAYADEPERATILGRLHALYSGPWAANEKALRVLEMLAQLDPQGSAARAVCAAYIENGRARDALAWLERAHAAAPADPAGVVTRCLEMARLATEKLSDRDRAAGYLHTAFMAAPRDPEVFARYAEQFRERRDFRGLVELLEFTLSDATLAQDQRLARLEEIAQLAETRLGDLARAEVAWQHIEQLAPTSRATEARRRLASRLIAWQGAVRAAESEIAAATDDEGRFQATRRFALLVKERHIDHALGVALWRTMVELRPQDIEAQAGYIEAAERDHDDVALASALMLRLSQSRGQGSEGGGGRAEKLATLRRLAVLAESKTHDVEQAVFACEAILEQLPADRDAMDRLVRVLDEANDARLEAAIERRSAHGTTSERVALLARLVGMAASRGDRGAVIVRLQQWIRLAPTDVQATSLLLDAYEQDDRLTEYVHVASAFVERHPTGYLPERLRLARVLCSLGDTERAAAIWRAVLCMAPSHQGARRSLIEYCRRTETWDELAQLLEPLAKGNDNGAILAAEERAVILEERLGQVELATAQWVDVHDRLAPGSTRASAALRRIYSNTRNAAGLCLVLERAADHAADDAARIPMWLEVADIAERQVGDPDRALDAFERILAVRADHQAALREAARLWGRREAWRNQADRLEQWCALLADVDQRQAIMRQLASIYSEHLADAHGGLAWLLEAHELRPDGESLQALRQYAAQYQLWSEWALVLRSEIGRLAVTTPASDDRAQHAHELTTLLETRLHDVAGAIGVIAELLQGAPRERSHLQAIAEIIERHPSHAGLFGAQVDVALRASTPDEQIALLLWRARVADERLQDLQAARADLLAAFAWDPGRAEPRDALLQLAQRTGQWADVIAMESALAERALRDADRLNHLRNKARLWETRASDLPRAFRVMLAAFSNAPRESDLHSELWRLAVAIGTYQGDDGRVTAEPPAAKIATASEHRAANDAARAYMEAARLGTQEMIVDETTEQLSQPPSPPPSTPVINRSSVRGEQTTELTLADVRDVVPATRADVVVSSTTRGEETSELTTSELREVMRPPRPPQKTRQPQPPDRRIVPAPPLARKAQATMRPSPTQLLIGRTFASPWDEWLAVYDYLAAADPVGRLDFQLAAAHVCECGLVDMGRTFEMLGRALDVEQRVEPKVPRVRAELVRLASEHSLWHQLADFYEGRAEQVGIPAQAIDLLLEAAAIRQRVGQTGDAEILYRRVLGMDPNAEAARRALVAQYRSAERWSELAAVLEEQTDPRLGAVAPAMRRAELLEELIALYTTKLHRPADATAALERLAATTPQDAGVLVRLASAYESLGRWSRVVEVLEQAVDHSAQNALPLLRKIARIVDSELRSAERAIMAWEQVTEFDANALDAWAALDRLYGETRRASKQLDAVRRRAQLVTAADARANLLRRQAELESALGQSTLAAATLRLAQSLAPHDAAVEAALVGTLAQAGNSVEALREADRRVEQAAHADPTTHCAALVQRAELRLASSDVAGGRADIDAALQCAPDDANALRMLMRQTETSEPTIYVAASLRLAEQGDEEARISASLEAAHILAHRCGDSAGAEHLLRDVLVKRAGHQQAMQQLVQLAVARSDRAGAIGLLSSLLETASGPERSSLLVHLGRTEIAHGDTSSAERHLLEAFSIDPSCAESVLALSGLYATAKRVDDELALLADASTSSGSWKPADQIACGLLYAAVLERAQRPDDAASVLAELDRTHRGQLAVKRALGMNRFAAKRWREAAIHLGALANHPDAASDPVRVAEGLACAAQAEIRSLRPERAPALFGKALQLDPTNVAALAGAAEIAMERGEYRQAADLLARQAASTTDPSEKVRLFEALGDLALDVLHDAARAGEYYLAAVKAAHPLGHEHAGLLDKLIAQKSHFESPQKLAESLELLAGISSAPEAAELLARAARHYREANLHDNAKRAARAAVGADAVQLTALTIAAECWLVDDPAWVADCLGRALAQVGFAAQEHASLARLWSLFGQARDLLGDARGAQQAFVRSLELAPQAEGSAALHRRLAMAGHASAPTIVEHWRSAVAQTGEASDLLAWAGALQKSGQADMAALAFELAATQGATIDMAAEAFLLAHRPISFADDQAYAGTLTSSDRLGVLGGVPMLLDDVLAVLAEHSSLLWPDPADALRKAGLGTAVRASRAEARALRMWPLISAAVGTGPVVAYTHDDSDGPIANVLCANTPLLVLGPQLLAENVDARLLRYQLGVFAEQSRGGNVVAYGLPQEEYFRTLAGVLDAFGGATHQAAAEALVSDAAIRSAYGDLVRAALPVRARTQLERLLASSDEPIEPIEFRRVHDRVAGRIGLALTGDARLPSTAGMDVSDCARAIAHRDWPALRVKLGIALRRDT